MDEVPCHAKLHHGLGYWSCENITACSVNLLPPNRQFAIHFSICVLEIRWLAYIPPWIPRSRILVTDGQIAIRLKCLHISTSALSGIEFIEIPLDRWSEKWTLWSAFTFIHVGVFKLPSPHNMRRKSFEDPERKWTSLRLIDSSLSVHDSIT